MRLRDVVREEKKNMPDYWYRFTYHFAVPIAIICVGSGLLAMIAELIIKNYTENEFWLSFPYILTCAIIFILLIVIIIVGTKVNRRLQRDMIAGWAGQFAPMDADDAAQTLKEVGLIEDDCLIVGEERVPLKNCYIRFTCSILYARYNLGFDILRKMNMQRLAQWEMDRETYAYFSAHREWIMNRELFDLFFEDRTRFLRMMRRYGNDQMMYSKLMARRAKGKNKADVLFVLPMRRIRRSGGGRRKLAQDRVY